MEDHILRLKLGFNDSFGLGHGRWGLTDKNADVSGKQLSSTHFQEKFCWFITSLMLQLDTNF